ncbi:MAG: hypothetical protein M3Z33_04080 [Actinomycetota bacterium]|nr:hypothetical protein [Actinomycetota bacterium]
MSDPETPPAEPPPPALPIVGSQHAHRFRLVLGALIGIAIGAVAATLVVASGNGAAPDTRWSAWHPRSTAVASGAQQIADHVAPSYRQSDGDQLVGVTGGPLKVGQLNLSVRIAVADSGARNIGIVGGKSALYTLCGLGSRCAINRGKPSTERGLLLRREALELALYSFHYLDGIDSVVALMPPLPGHKPQNAVFFKRDGLQTALDRPLPQTLPSPPPTVVGLMQSPQATFVNSVTSPSVFCYSFEQGQDLGAFLVLQKPTSDPKKPCK